MSQQQQRRLALHASALSDAEYGMYTESLKDIVLGDEDGRGGGEEEEDDGYFAQMEMGVREARAWLRGRYASVASAMIDSILRLFSPTLAPGDTLSGAEFFAALRLVVHAQSGAMVEVDRSLAFVQADPAAAARQQLRSTPSTSRTHSPVKRHAELAPPPPKPFRQQSSTQQPPLHPSQRSESSRSLGQAPSHNPFTAQRNPAPPRSEDGAVLPPLPPRKGPASVPSTQLPPPPPRPRQRADRSLSPTKGIGSSSSIRTAPAPPPKPSHHVTSTLMKQSLHASHIGASLQRAEAMLEKERVMQVLRSSSSNTSTSHAPSHPVHLPQYASSASASSDDHASAPPLPQRRSRAAPPPPAQGSKPRMGASDNEPRQQPSPPMSTSSLEQVALAGVSSSPTKSAPRPPPQRRRDTEMPGSSRSELDDRYSSPFRSPPDAANDSTDYFASPPSSAELRNGPPPTHPDRTLYPSGLGRREANLESFEAVYGPMVDVPAAFSNAAFPTSTSAYSPFSPTSPTFAVSPSTPPGPGQRVFRSKSMHHPSPPPSSSSSSTPQPPPPSGRKRPESVQVLPGGSPFGGAAGAFGGYGGLGRNTSLAGGNSAHRRSTLSVSSTPSASHTDDPFASSGVTGSPMSGIQRTLAGLALQPKLDGLNAGMSKAREGLDKARYKAEAGLSRRGYVRHGHVGGGGFEYEGGLSGDDGGGSRERDEREREEMEGLVGGPRGTGMRKGKGAGNVEDKEKAEFVGRGYGYELEREWDSDDEMASEGSYTARRQKKNRRQPDFEDDLEERPSVDKGPDVDSDSDDAGAIRGGTYRSRPLGSGGASGLGLQEKDNLKWPAGEGWKPL